MHLAGEGLNVPHVASRSKTFRGSCYHVYMQAGMIERERGKASRFHVCAHTPRKFSLSQNFFPSPRNHARRKTKKQYLLICKVSGYCTLAFWFSDGPSPAQHWAWFRPRHWASGSGRKQTCGPRRQEHVLKDTFHSNTSEHYVFIISNVDLMMLGQRCRCWPNIKSTLGEYNEFAGNTQVTSHAVLCYDVPRLKKLFLIQPYVYTSLLQKNFFSQRS